MTINIRRRLFFQIGGLVLLLISFVIIANSLLMAPYYTWQKKQELLRTYDLINALDQSAYDSVALTSIEASTGFDVAIFSSDNNLLYTNNPKVREQVPLAPTNRPKHEIIDREQINENVFIVHLRDTGIKLDFYALEGSLDNGLRLHLQFPLAAISTNINLLNQFLIIIGVLILGIASLVAYGISIYFTNPIRSMNEVTKSMKALDFSKRCQIDKNDELGQLAESINELSDELAKTIDQLHQSHLSLEEKVEETISLADKRKRLLSNVAHELKTPLSLMQGYTEGFMIFAKEDQEKAEKYAHIIHDETLKMNHLIERLLDIEQIESGSLITQLDLVDVGVVLENLKEVLQPIANKENANIHIEINGNVKVMADIILLEQAFMNLISNGIHHSIGDKVVALSVTEEAEEVAITCKNPAKPLEENVLSSLWDSFYKVDSSRSREAGGHGLGLSIVKSIVEAHGGSYRVEQDQGSIIFTLTFHK